MTAEPFPTARSLLEKHGLFAKKSWGQNFLVSERVYRAIVDATVEEGEDWIVEIGAGLGTLTMRLAQRVPDGMVYAVERDRDMLSVLEAELAHLENVEVIPANALTYDLGTLSRYRGDTLTVCGNLPYNIASQILFRIIEQREFVRRAVVMLQKEMADRLAAAPGSKTYGVLSALIGAYARISRVIRAKPSAFVPPPKVDSAVVRLELAGASSPAFAGSHPKPFSELVHAAFATRRKTIRNNLKAHYGEDRAVAALEASDTDPQIRAEMLSPAELSALASAVFETRDA